MVLLITGDDIISFESHWKASFCHLTVLHTAVLWLWSDTKADKSLQKHGGHQGGHRRVGTCKIASHREQKAWGLLLAHSLSPCTLIPGPALGAEAHHSLALNDDSSSTGLQENWSTCKLGSTLSLLTILLIKESIHNTSYPCTDLTKTSLFLEDGGQLLPLNATQPGFMHFVAHIYVKRYKNYKHP